MIYLITLIALIIITAVLYFKGSEFAGPIAVICIIGFFHLYSWRSTAKSYKP